MSRYSFVMVRCCGKEGGDNEDDMSTWSYKEVV